MGRACAWTLCASVVYAGISLACARRVVPSAEIFSRSVDSIADEVKMETVPEPGPRLLKHTFISPKPAVVVAKSPDEHLVESLPGLKAGDFTTKHYAGYIPVVDGFHFYWLFESSGKDPSSDPLVIWLNGGPGCSSMDGLWLENGPFRLDSNQDVTTNPYSWHNVANVLYVDQPVGTGLSFTVKDNFADNDQQVDEQFYLFLTNFLELHSQYKIAGERKSRPVFFTGESHAGHYIPSMIHHIMGKNREAEASKKGNLVIDVQGMAIGNGWFDPISQYDVSDFAFGMGLIDGGQRRALKKKEKKCLESLNAGNYGGHSCLGLMDSVVDESNGKASGVPKVSMYDVRNYEIGRQFPPGHTIVEAYLNRDDVIKAIHATSCPARFQECRDLPFVHLSKWDGLGVTNEVRAILNAGIRSLFFNGQYDLICNHVGNEKALMNLGDWNGAEAWESSTRGVWLSDGKGEDDKGGHMHPLGYVKEKKGNPLTFLIVLNSGHMVPLDHPRPALDMLTRFLRNMPFSDKIQQNLGVGSCSEPDIDCYNGDAPVDCAPVAKEDNKSLVWTDVSFGAPDMVGTPKVGQDFAIVDFSPSVSFLRQGFEGGVVDSAFGSEKPRVKFEVQSSPDGLLGFGPSAPISVEGLTPGRTYTFSVSAVFPQDQMDKWTFSGAGKVREFRSSPSIGSVAVTPGCGPAQVAGGGGGEGIGEESPLLDTFEEVCSGHGVCREGGHAGVCMCESGYLGKKCEMSSNLDSRGGKGWAEGTAADVDTFKIKILIEDDIPMFNESPEQEKNRGGELGLRFLLRPGAFRDPDFVFAIQIPRLQPPENPTLSENPSQPSLLLSTTVDSDEVASQVSAFSALLRADVGQALGVSMKAVDLTGVSPAGETSVDWQEWTQWGVGALNVSVVITSDMLGDTGRRLLSAWNDPASRLHIGAVTGLIDFSQGAKVTMLSEDRLSSANSRDFKGPTLFVTFLYIACFALTVPICGLSRRFFAHRKRGVGIGRGVSDSGGSSVRRRSVSERRGRGAQGSDQEMAFLAGDRT